MNEEVFRKRKEMIVFEKFKKLFADYLWEFERGREKEQKILFIFCDFAKKIENSIEIVKLSFF